MKERPIRFTGDEVRAIIDGRKTRARRLVKFPINADSRYVTLTRMQTGFADGVRPVFGAPDEPNWFSVKSPLGTVGDRLWVRETWAPHCEMSGAAIYRCDRGGDYQDTVTENFRWRPSIHMPRWASRIDLEITAVRVERVQDITEKDAKKEGIETTCPCVGGCDQHRKDFRKLWQSIYGNRPTLPKNPESKRYHRVKRWLEKNPPTGWDANPFVWVYEFRRIKP